MKGVNMSMALIRVEPIEPIEDRLCQVDTTNGFHIGDGVAVVIGQFPLAGGIVELRLCATCWRKILEYQQDGAGWMYTDVGRDTRDQWE